MARRYKKPLDSEKKLELAKAIAEKSQTFKATYSNIEKKVLKAFRTFSEWIDFILFNQRFSKLVAAVLAVVLYLVINGGAGNSVFSNVRQVVELENVPVIHNLDPKVYEVSDLPETVNVDVKGDAGDVQYVNQQKNNYKVIADLTEFDEGTHEVTLEPMNFSSKVDVSIQPSTVMVTIKKKASARFTIGYDFTNTNKMDKIYSLGEPEFAQNVVIVRASEDTLNQISFVKALIDLEGVKGDFTQDAVLVAYDQEGKQLPVDIQPETVNVKVKVTTPKKKVKIRIIPEGEMPEGKAIDSYSLDESEIVIYAPQKVLDEINYVDIRVPVNKIKDDTTITMPVMLPTGVSKANVTKVQIALKIKDAAMKEIKDIPITVKADAKFKAFLTEEDKKVSLKVRGSKAVLEQLKADDFTVIADLKDFDKAGVYEVSYSVKCKNTLVTWNLLKEKVKVILEDK